MNFWNVPAKSWTADPPFTKEELENRIARRQNEVDKQKLRLHKLYDEACPQAVRGDDCPKTPDPRDYKKKTKATWRWDVLQWQRQFLEYVNKHKPSHLEDDADSETQADRAGASISPGLSPRRLHDVNDPGSFVLDETEEDEEWGEWAKTA